MTPRVLCTGAGGFVGGHLVTYLKEKGYWVRGVDIKEHEFVPTDADEFEILDLRHFENALIATRDVDWVFGLAASMGGAQFVFTGANDLEIMHDNALINLNTLRAAHINGIQQYAFSSSFCIYPRYAQATDDAPLLNESMAYPAECDSAYGWEKLFTEHLCGVYSRQTKMGTRIARFANIMGELGTWRGGREKLPAAASRKVAVAKLTGNPVVDVIGDGGCLRSYCHVSDLVEMLYRLMTSDYAGPVNLGADRSVTVDYVFDAVADIAGIEIEKRHFPDGPTGIRARNADLSLMRSLLGYEPQVSLEEGLRRVYTWVEAQVKEALERSESVQ